MLFFCVIVRRLPAILCCPGMFRMALTYPGARMMQHCLTLVALEKYSRRPLYHSNVCRCRRRAVESSRGGR